MIVRNEAPIVRECLGSVRPVIDHWVIVDTGSTDGTQQIVRDALADLPGTLVERPWQDFAHNRTEALALARPHGTYSLIIDADDTLEVPTGYQLPDLDLDSYSVDIEFGASLYRRPHLVRAALPWRYDGVIHEFLACEEAQSSGHLPLVMRIGQGGARRRDPDTYKRDAAVLERALADAPSDFLRSRYTFYLAQSYRDSGEPEKAIPLYLARADLGFWHEEIYCSLVEAGRLMQRVGRPLEEVLAVLERAMTVVPRRAEALHAASFACRMAGDTRRGTGYGQCAAAMPLPDQGLFLERWIYEYGALDEWAINAYWAGDHRASLDAVMQALAGGHVPAEQRPRFLANGRFALEKLAAHGAMAATADGAAGAHAMVPPRTLGARLPEPAPRILLAILAKQKARVLPFFLRCIEALDYPKSAIVLYVRTNNNTDETKHILEDWLARVRRDYAAVEFDDADVSVPVQDFGVHEWNVTRFRVLNHIRDVSLGKTAEHGCAFYFTVDCDNFVRPCTLRNLVATGLPITAPLLRHIEPGRLYSNYHAAIDAAGYFMESDTYQPILFRHVTGLIELPVVHCTYLVRADAAAALGYNDGSDDFDYVIFSRRARAAGISQYFDNRQVYGYITLDDHDPDAVGPQLERARRLMAVDDAPAAPRFAPYAEVWTAAASF